MAATIKKFTRAEVKKHNDRTNTWIIIENKVCDVTKFLQEHPGGEEPLLEVAGKDGTKEFIDVGHSSEARELMEKYVIGEIVDEEKTTTEKSVSVKTMIKSNVKELKCRLKPIAPCLAVTVVLVGAFVAYRFYRSSNSQL
ncbi:hypothetical protein HHI36_013654 [Cryptolaemus montrouzieri]|uniref:Cytochrome b5 n=1 Tax=Cryptolaemus montrouzieri TaxID=559131 RepID=A0ABD2NI36_9CUCU